MAGAHMLAHPAPRHPALRACMSGQDRTAAADANVVARRSSESRFHSKPRRICSERFTTVSFLRAGAPSTHSSRLAFL
jgi:hypothetical protein